MPDTWLDGLARPLLLADSVAGLYAEIQAPDWRFAALVLLLVIASTFTGEILGWDNSSYWRVRGLLEGLERLPLIGAGLADIVRGGPEVSATTLSRTYTAHAMFVPWMVWMLLMANLALIVRDMRRINGGAA